MRWSEFEPFVLDIIAKAYPEFSVSASNRAFSEDDSETDCEALYVIGMGIGPNGGPSYRVCIDVKRRTGSKIKLGDLSTNFFAEIAGSAKQLFIVTNNSFDEAFVGWIEDYAQKNGLQRTLIDGQALRELAAKHYDSANQSVTKEFISTSEGTGDPAAIEMAVRFSLNRFSLTSIEPGTIKVDSRSDRPIFVLVDLKIPKSLKPWVAPPALRLANPAAGKLFALPSMLQNEPLRARECRSTIYVFWPGEQTSGDVDLLEVMGDPSATGIKANLHYHNRLKIHDVPIHAKPTQRQEEFLLRARSALNKWLSTKDSAALAVISPPGVGKSYLFGALRRYCHSEQISEVFFDCETVRNEVDLARRLISAILPIPSEGKPAQFAGEVVKWCQGLGLSESHAEGLAEELTGDLSDISPAVRADVVTRLLSFQASSKRQVFFLEDLHKALPSLISMLARITENLSSSSEDSIFFVVSSRPSPEAQAETDEWYSEFGKFLRVDSLEELHLTQPSPEDAAQFLRDRVPSMEEHHVSLIVEKVGTSVYNLKEALLFLLGTGALGRIPGSLPVLELQDPSKLAEAIRSRRIEKSTESRLNLGYSANGNLQPFLAAAGAFGKVFPVKAVVLATGLKEDFSFARMLEFCVFWGILRTSATGAEHLEFDHDLMRETVVKQTPLWALQRYSRSLVESEIARGRAPDALVCRLAYQAGMVDKCLELSHAAVSNAKAQGRIADAFRINNTALQALDGRVAKLIQSKAKISSEENDCAAQLVLDRQAQLISSDHGAILKILLDNLDCLSTIGSGSSDMSGATISEAMLIAEMLSKEFELADLKSQEGRFYFERDDVISAKKLHEEAEERFLRLGPERSSSRSENLIRLAICLRALGHKKDSRLMLVRALQARPAGKAGILSKIVSNLGAIYLDSDWTKVRHHWGLYLNHARRHRLKTRVVHALASLSFIDVFEGRLNQAGDRIETALLMSEELGLENQTLRLLLNASVMAMAAGRPQEALAKLFRAEAIGLRFGIVRRLWRVVANLATVHELLGNRDKAIARDRQVLNLLDVTIRSWSEQVEIHSSGRIKPKRWHLALVNIALREWGQELFKSPGLEAAGALASTMAAQVKSERLDAIPSLLGNYCLRTAAGPRFGITE